VSADHPLPGGAARAMPWLLALAALALSVALSTRFPLLDPDEGRNAEEAREMLESGDFLVPRLAGMPSLDKPPALFWAVAASVRAFGHRPWAARLPSALSAALIVLLVSRRALRAGDRALAWRAAALLAAAPLFAVLSAYVIFDMALALCVSVVWLGVLGEQGGSGRATARLAMFAAVALGILIKGPVMLAWAAGGSACAALLLRSRAPVRWLAWWPGWLIVVAVAGGWFALASARFPEYPRYAFLEETFQRLTTGAYRREQPVWFVPVVLVAGALPWSLATPWTRKLSRESLASLGFVLFAALFFTVSRSKLVTYLIPAFPMLAWVAAEAWSDPARRRRGAWGIAIVYAALAIGFAVAGWGGALARVRPPLEPSAFAAAKLAALLFGAVAALGIAAALARPAAAFAGALLFTPIVMLAAGSPLRAYAETESGAALARAVAAAAPGAAVRYEACYSPGTDFLLGRRGSLESERGLETTSVYQSRYRETLIARGQWLRAPAAGGGAPRDTVIVWHAGRSGAPRAGAIEIFRDRRVSAFLVTRPSN
jgi:4-amino-4-deoxy-L-arabinose transferase-like glycosyltransferase